MNTPTRARSAGSSQLRSGNFLLPNVQRAHAAKPYASGRVQLSFLRRQPEITSGRESHPVFVYSKLKTPPSQEEAMEEKRACNGAATMVSR